MLNVYWAHSYRDEDRGINRYFGRLIEKTNLQINFDPPSEGVNEAKLEQNLRSCGGMVAILTWRPNGPSQYILYEVALALRARKPLLVFVDDRLPGKVLPERILQRRFSHRTYGRQASDHAHALRIFAGYLEQANPLRYQPGADQRTCGIVGFGALDKGHRAEVDQFVTIRGYQLIDLERVDDENLLAFARYEHLANLEIALRFVDSPTRRSLFWSGALSAAAIPSITVTSDAGFSYSELYPREFQPRLANAGTGTEMDGVLAREFDLYEEHFFEADDEETIDRYVNLREQAGPSNGRYEPGTRIFYTENLIMGDKNIASGPGSSVISRSTMRDVQFNQQIWKQVEDIDLEKLAAELHKLGEAMKQEATEPEHHMAVGAITAAEQSARQKEGPKTVEYLRAGGRWALVVAQKIGVELAVAVFHKILQSP